MLDGLLILNAGIVAGASVVPAISASEDRLPATLCAAGLTASWGLYVTSWSQWSAAAMLSAYAFDTSSVDLWAMANGLNGLLCLYLWCVGGQRQSWLVVLYLLLLGGCTCDVLWWARLVSWASFKGAIDLIFAGEMAVLYLVGGRNVSNRVGRTVVRWLGGHSHSAARFSSPLVIRGRRG